MSDEELDAMAKGVRWSQYPEDVRVDGEEFDAIITQAREANALRAEIAELREDAERYRLMRKQDGSGSIWCAMFNFGHQAEQVLCGDDLDVAVDAIAKGAGT